MRIGIDASNLRRGGGVTHLVELLCAAEPADAGIDRVRVWGGAAMLAKLPAGKPWLEPVHEPALDRGLLHRLRWQRGRLGRLARQGCAVLFVPGGAYAGSFRPFVTMCRNMLPFERGERARYGWSPTRLRLELLRVAQRRTFRRADGLIFLNEYAAQRVAADVRRLDGAVATIPHGVSTAFRCAPRPQHPPTAYGVERPFRLLYVSSLDLYKFQWTVAEAVASLRGRGLPIEIGFVGPAYAAAFARLEQVMRTFDPAGAFLHYEGALHGRQLVERYRDADAFVFASSCENMPNILLEAMASGLPIACSSRGPMPEILRDGGVYFDPEKPGTIAEAVERIFRDDALRTRLAAEAFARAAEFSWEECARRTFAFLAAVARKHDHR